jgi:CheY-like chemotaxis protein
MNDSLGHLTVLAVDDSLQMRRIMQSMLAEIGINQIFTAKDGFEALNFMGNCDDLIDMILCDWKMPHMTGLEFLRQVRTADPDIPFIMVTGKGDEQSVLEAKAHGVSSFIVKPFSANQLEKKILGMVRLMAAKKELA